MSTLLKTTVVTFLSVANLFKDEIDQAINS